MPTPTKERVQDLLGIYGSLKQLMGAPSPSFLAASLIARNQVNATAVGKAWRPPEWAKDLSNADNPEKITRTMMTVEDSEGTLQHYFFDAVFATDHNETRQITQHPIQRKAAITDHSFDVPSTVVIEIGMSDVMDNFVLPSVYETDTLASSASGNSTQKVISSSFVYPKDGGGKSVNAYRAFVNIKRSGVLVKLTTRLNTYDNMLIENIQTKDDRSTTYSLKCRISFTEIFLGEIVTISKSLYPAATHPQERNRAEAKALDDNQYVQDTSALGAIRYNRPWLGL